MKAIEIQLGGKRATCLEFSGGAPAAHFYHANGFPGGVYRQFLEYLSPELGLSALNMRACWPEMGVPNPKSDWTTYADDLIEYLDLRSDGPIIGIGHSMGATSTLIAAAKRPDLFKALVLIEPATVDGWMKLALQIVPYSLKKKVKIMKAALERQNDWESPEAFFERYRKKGVFKRISDSGLQDLAEHSLRPGLAGGFELVFSGEWEAHNYGQAGSLWPWLNEVDLPILAVKGQQSVFLSDSIWRKWKAGVKQNTTFVEMKENGHLIPLENPIECGERVGRFLGGL